MRLSIIELKEILSLIDKPIDINVEQTDKSITIKVKCKKDSDILTRSININGIEINQTGIYDCDGLKVWVVKE